MAEVLAESTMQRAPRCKAIREGEKNKKSKKSARSAFWESDGDFALHKVTSHTLEQVCNCGRRTRWWQKEVLFYNKYEF